LPSKTKENLRKKKKGDSIGVVWFVWLGGTSILSTVNTINLIMVVPYFIVVWYGTYTTIEFVPVAF
jgi:hypothetical protein